MKTIQQLFLRNKQKTQNQNKSILLGIGSLFWLMATFIGYLYAHKPFTLDELIGVFTALWQTLIAILILSAAGGLGMMTYIRDWEVPPLAKAILTSAIGLGILSITILILAVTVGVHLPIKLLLPIIFISSWKKIVSWWSNWKSASSSLRELNSFAILLLLPILVIFISQYLDALAPPLQFDALTYHLVLPKAYLQFGKLIYIPENIFWGMPQLTEMLYLLAISLGGLEAAIVLGFFVGVLAVLGLADYIKSTCGGNAGWVIIAILFAGTGFTSSFSSGYVEWMSILFGVTTLLTLFQWVEKKDLKSLVIAGIFVGLSLSIKYTNGVMLLATIAVILFISRSVSFALVFRNLVWFVGAATLTFTPWMAKNFLLTGNPFYPIIFPSGAMNEILLDFYQFKPTEQDWSRLLLLPLQATILGVDGGDGFSASIGPLFLGLSPLAWLNWHRQPPAQKNMVKISSIILFSGFLIWAIGSQFRGLLIQTRLYFILFPAWAILGSIGFINVSQLRTQSIRFGNLAVSMILLAIVFNAFSTIRISIESNPLLVIFNHEDDFNYMKRHLGGYTYAMQAIESLSSDSKVIMLWETRSLMCIPKCDPDEIIGKWYNDWTIHRNAKQIIFQWKEQGYTHVLINTTGAEFVHKYDGNAPPEEYWDGLETALSYLVNLNLPVDGYQLYQIP